MGKKDSFEVHTKENNIAGLNTIIEILQNIKNSKDIGKYKITAEIKKFCMHDHTKGSIVKTSQIGSKIEITISEGTLANIDKTRFGHFIRDEE